MSGLGLQARQLVVVDHHQLSSPHMSALTKLAAQVTVFDQASDALEYIDQQSQSLVVLMDMAVPDMPCAEFIQAIKQISPFHIVLVISSLNESGVISTVICAGADDFISAANNKERIVSSVNNALNQCVKQEIKNNFEAFAFRDGYLGYIGDSEPMRHVYRQIQNAAISHANVFITGESGTGKDVCAQAIHSISHRNAYEMVSINCGAISASLMESEIFGHMKGAFTGAEKNREGAALRADKGTLFLDEIGEMNYELQSKLLRLVQQGVLSPLGSDSETHVDVRFISATNKSPLHMIELGEFREDLFYRLNAIQIHMPSLRERSEDVLLIAQRCLQDSSEQESKHFKEFTQEAKEILMDYPWPGNVRELKNIIQNIVINHDAESVLPSMIPMEILLAVSQGPEVVTQGVMNNISMVKQGELDEVLNDIDRMSANTIMPLRRIESLAIKKAIELCDGNIKQAAHYLEVAPSTIYRKVGR